MSTAGQRLMNIVEHIEDLGSKFDADCGQLRRVKRAPGVPADWRLLAANDEYQTFSDHGHVRFFRCSDGQEIHDDSLV